MGSNSTLSEEEFHRLQVGTSYYYY